METVSTTKSFGGTQGVYRHASTETGTPMTFAVFVPPQADGGGKFPVLWFLSGLTCTHANVMDKGGYQRVAADLGLIVVAPDTSPRGDAADADGYDLGRGAGFYLDATEAPWAANYRMGSYVVAELPRLIGERFPADMDRQGITGHSMGGHGALTLALRNPDRFRSVSAFAPIVAPSRVPWGEKAFGAYLGADRSRWHAHDAVSLIGAHAKVADLLVDQGEADNFLAEQLRPHLLVEACRDAGIPLTLRMQPGYDHGYGFVATFMEDHLRWHAERLGA